MALATSQQVEEYKKFQWFILHHRNNCTVCGKEFEVHEKSYFGHLHDGTCAYTCETCSKNLCDARFYTIAHKKNVCIPEPKTRLWRYMDLAKFLSLLESNSLFFTRLDHFADPFEGALGVIENEEVWKKKEKERIKQWLEVEDKYAKRNSDESELETRAVQHFNRYREKLKDCRTRNYVSCWHMSDYESEAMWQLYTRDCKQGIAIQTTFDRLYHSLLSELNFDFGLVNYIDYNKYNNGNSNKRFSLFDALWYKRKSFEHEKEFRIIVEDDRKPAFRDIDKSIEIDLVTLIENVYISPQAEEWFVKLVQEIITKRYNLDLRIHQSDLTTLPFY